MGIHGVGTLSYLMYGYFYLDMIRDPRCGVRSFIIRLNIRHCLRGGRVLIADLGQGGRGITVIVIRNLAVLVTFLEILKKNKKIKCFISKIYIL